MVEKSVNTDIEDKEIAFDLRQEWVKLVGEQLSDLKESKKSGVYSKYFAELEDLYDLVQQKFKDREETKNKLQTLMREAAILATKYPGVWNGKVQSAEACSLIYDKLRVIERELYDAMEEGNMYGGYYDDEGL